MFLWLTIHECQKVKLFQNSSNTNHLFKIPYYYQIGEEFCHAVADTFKYIKSTFSGESGYCGGLHC